MSTLHAPAILAIHARRRTGKSIVHVADYAPNYSGNFIASLKLAAEQCRARGFRVVWVFPDDVRNFQWFQELARDADATAYTLSRKNGVFQNARRIAEIAMDENAAIVHTHFSRFDIAAWLAKVYCMFRLRSFHLVWHMHSALADHIGARRRVLDFVKLGLMGRMCYAVPVSYPLEETIQHKGFPNRRIRVIQNGIDVSHATARKSAREEVRKQLGIAEGTWVMLGFGWTPVRKGVDTMLEALKILVASGMRVILVLVGTEELNTYLRRWQDREILDYVRVIPPEEFVGDLFAASDTFISPSRAEGWPYSVAEAMANGVAVACSSIPAVSWAANAPGVFFSAPGDAEELADNVFYVAMLPQEERRKMTSQSREFITSRHTVERWGESVWKLYADLLDWDDSARTTTQPVTAVQ